MQGQPQGLGQANRSVMIPLSMVSLHADRIYVPNDNDQTCVGPRQVPMIEQG